MAVGSPCKSTRVVPPCSLTLTLEKASRRVRFFVLFAQLGLLVRASAATCSANSASESISEGARIEGVIAGRFSKNICSPNLWVLLTLRAL